MLTLFIRGRGCVEFFITPGVELRLVPFPDYKRNEMKVSYVITHLILHRNDPTVVVVESDSSFLFLGPIACNAVLLASL
jgi:hypothetical protein